VDVTQVGTNVSITATLAAGYQYAQTALADFQIFKFNGIGVALTDIVVGGHVPGLGAATGAFNGDGTGNFSFGINCPTCGNGPTGFGGAISFTIVNATIAEVTAPNELGNVFVADIFSSQTGNAGPVGSGSINSPPVANAGPNQNFDIKSGATVQLNGSGSTDDNTPTASLIYQWNQLYGPTVTLTGAKTETPSFIPPAIGTYVFGLVVTDNGTPPLSSTTPTLAAGATSCVPSGACVMVSAYNQPPSAVATAFPTIAYVKETVTLNGTGSSDPEGDAITFAWSLTCSPTGSNAGLASSSIPTATTSIIPDVPGTYAATLTVTDSFHFLPPPPSPVQPCPASLPSVQSPQQTTVTFIADTAQLFAVTQIISANKLVSSLVATQVTTSGNQTAFGNFLSQAVTAIQAGKTADAITKLNNAIQRTNGCAINNPPAPDGPGPGMDWVTDCAVQTSLLAYLNAALSALTAP
jgi:hypothetical protein